MHACYTFSYKVGQTACLAFGDKSLSRHVMLADTPTLVIFDWRFQPIYGLAALAVSVASPIVGLALLRLIWLIQGPLRREVRLFDVAVLRK